MQQHNGRVCVCCWWVFTVEVVGGGGGGRVAFGGYIISLLGCNVQLSLHIAAFFVGSVLYFTLLFWGFFIIIIIWDKRHAKYSRMFWFFICFCVFLEAGGWGVTVYTHRNNLATHTNRLMAGVCEKITICNEIMKNNTAIILMISWYTGAFVQPLLTIIQVLTQIHPSHTQTHMQAHKYIIHTKI